MRVLQVEDDATTAAAVKHILEAKGHACDTAESGEDAVEQARSNDYDMILLDLMLPGIDGFEVLRRLQAEEIRIPVLVQSGLIGRDEKVKGLSLGVEEFLVKPISAGELSQRLDCVAERQAEAKEDPAAAPAESHDAADRGDDPKSDCPLRRQAKRTRMLKSGQIIYNNASCVIDCVLKDISDNGAKLEVPDIFECPDDITLRILHGPTYRCKVRWQNGKSLGVEFMDV